MSAPVADIGNPVLKYIQPALTIPPEACVDRTWCAAISRDTHHRPDSHSLHLQLIHLVSEKLERSRREGFVALAYMDWDQADTISREEITVESGVAGVNVRSGLASLFSAGWSLQGEVTAGKSREREDTWKRPAVDSLWCSEQDCFALIHDRVEKLLQHYHRKPSSSERNCGREYQIVLDLTHPPSTLRR